MDVCFVSRGKIAEFYEHAYEKADVILFGFQAMGEVSYESELRGESSYFEEVARLSRQTSAIVVCGCITDAKGHKRKSAVVAEDGRILGVSDMINVIDGEVGSGANLRIYDTKIGKIGVLIAEDLYFPDAISALALCGAEYILCPYGELDGVETTLCRSSAFYYGLPVLLCGNGYSAVAEPSGELAFSTPCSPSFVRIENPREYHLVETRRRGFYKPPKKEY
jgi:predicted amidohydrolase